MTTAGDGLDVLFLGTGTSTGVPMIGCDCPVCTSKNPRNCRRRSCLYVRAGELALLIDTPPEFREQALAYDLRRVDALLFTHSHADHIFGLDDMRRFNTLQQAVIPAFATPQTTCEIRRIFDYISSDRNGAQGLYRPLIDFREVETPFEIGTVRVTPLDVAHGSGRTVGFRFDYQGRSLGYAPDCRDMPECSQKGFRGVDLMILDGLRHRPHVTHMTIAQSLEMIERLRPQRALLTHICHDIDHDVEQQILPPGVSLAWDGLRVRW